MSDIDIINYTKPSKDAIVLCLGFFDCIHLGHLKLIRLAKGLSIKYNAKASIFTFNNNPFKNISKQKLIYTFDERCQIFSSLGLDRVYYANFNKKFSNLTKEIFLKKLLLNKNVKAVVVGEDYTFGINKTGNIDYLKEYCAKNNIEIIVEKLIRINNEKLSTTQIREFIKNGDIKEANNLLVAPYIISGTVIKGNGIGHKKLYPTANILISKDKIKLKEGVYYTKCIIDKISFKSVTNVGKKPIVGDSSYSIETHILFYNKNIYGKNITLSFCDKIRDIKKFNSIDELKIQIEEDIKYVLNKGEIL